MSGPIYFPNLKKDSDRPIATGTTVSVLGEDHACLDVFIQNPAGLAADVDVQSVIPGVGATNLGKAEDAVHASGDVGVMALAVRNDAGSAFAADGDYVPLSVDATGNLRVSASLTESATAADGAVAPAVFKVIAGFDGALVQAIKTDAAGELQIDVLSSALPTGASTSALQTTGNTSLSSIDGKVPANLTVTATRLLVDPSGVTQPISAAALPLPTGASTSALQTTGNASLASIDAGTPAALGQTTMSASMPVVIASDQTAVPISAASLPLPSGASTAAKQPALGTAGTASADVITVQGIASMTPILVNGSAVTQPVSVAAAIPTKSPVNTVGTTVNTALTATTASSAVAPALTVGFILEAASGNTDNIRWALGTTASTTVGLLLEPGRDTGFVPCNATISVCSTVSGTNVFSLIWIQSA